MQAWEIDYYESDAVDEGMLADLAYESSFEDPFIYGEESSQAKSYRTAKPPKSGFLSEETNVTSHPIRR